ncbi:Lipase/lipooxygenase [Heracleum sosnowskyi]|uniref:Lipase/lipooxygenase n=1 Tax=Heracleum sosnowskyi TaxID=360622 RepID=A0AAD8M751_9APIA|nr:Lipase/lipooxygenase [Heracleum sosnowskyi]
MELLSTRHLISTPTRQLYLTNSTTLFHVRRKSRIYSKNSDYQDFQSFAKPSRLVSATEANTCTDSLEKLVKSFNLDQSETLYKVELRTSNLYGSGLTDTNSGIQLCVIDENGNSILQRLPVSSSKEHHMQSDNEVVSDALHFQRGSIDEFTFEGPKLQKIVAIWISPESGQWRLGGASLSIICQPQLLREESRKSDNSFIGLHYDFKTEDIQLGEGSYNSMTELKPCSITEFSGDNFTLLNESLLKSSSAKTLNVSNEESMREYEDLKNTLLLYDTLFILAGSGIASLSSEESAAFAFLTGGISGFLYLLFLQRSVDQLPAPELNKNEKVGFKKSLGKVVGTVSALALGLSFAAIALKSGSENRAIVVAPKDLVFGMMGFLTCKVAVLLAAFKPMSSSQREIQ